MVGAGGGAGEKKKTMKLVDENKEPWIKHHSHAYTVDSYSSNFKNKQPMNIGTYLDDNILE